MVAAILIPFVVAAFAPLLLRRAPRSGPRLLALVPAGLALAFGAELFSSGGAPPRLSGLAWVPALGIRASLRMDGLSLLFAFLITLVGSPVVLFAGRYLGDAVRARRFFAALFMFMGAMLGLVLADGLILLFVFWEITSVASWLLIGHDHERPEARAAALRALLVTGGGGLALLAGFVLLGLAGGSFEITDLLARGDRVRSHALGTPALLLILAGVFTKSAQVPFHFWLPGAMEAPAPASAYLHAATMVKAGIYLLARLLPVLGGLPAFESLVTTVGAVTMVTGGVLALRERTWKSLLAYSTVGALGMLVMLLGIGTPSAVRAALVLLVAHALYKGAMFLVAGIVDHETGVRDPERLRGLRAALPMTAAGALLAALSMAGLPPFFGFIAKEGVLDGVLGGAATSAAAVLSGALFIVVAIRAGIAPFAGRMPGCASLPAHETPPDLWAGPLLLGSLGLLAGLFPGLTGLRLVSPACEAVIPGTGAADLGHWHGVNAPFLLGLLSLGIGAFAFASRHRLAAFLDRAGPLLRAGPGAAFDRATRGLPGAAKRITVIFQSGSLRTYLAWTLVTALLLAGVALRGDSLPGLPAPRDVRIHEGILAAVIVIAAVFATITRSRLAAIAAMGVVGYGVALCFFLFGAPDLALTQFVVETFTVILFVLVFHRLPAFASLSTTRARLFDVTLCGAAGLLMTLLILAVQASAIPSGASEFYAGNAVPGGHGRNIVNVILVDFRALDTLGEITVLAVAALGVVALLRIPPGAREDRR